jgi:hypothetical protein
MTELIPTADRATWHVGQRVARKTADDLIKFKATAIGDEPGINDASGVASRALWRGFRGQRIVPMPTNNLHGLCGLRRGLWKHYRNRRHYCLSRNMVNLQSIRFC